MFDLSMQSALDIFCYVLVLIYGLALSADLSTGGYVSRQQKYLLTLLCLLFLLMQGLGLVLLGERAVKQLYPLVIHVPLVLILILFMKKSVGVAIVSTCTAYLCCQPPRWGRIAVEALTQSTLAAELVYILLMPVMYYLLRRFFVAAGDDLQALHQRHTGGEHGGDLAGDDGDVHRLDPSAALGKHPLALLADPGDIDALLAQLRLDGRDAVGLQLTGNLLSLAIDAVPAEGEDLFWCILFLS